MVNKSDTMTIRMRFFAATKDLTGVAEADHVLPSTSTSDDLIAYLQKAYPKLAAMSEQLPTILAVNHTFLPLGEVAELKCGDEVALIPPISGG